uniref:Uncharacterized protein n=1 Tax=Anguilla anguilla TaxID=7936 RepID=A0A0E9R4N3_ANGAN
MLVLMVVVFSVSTLCTVVCFVLLLNKLKNK